MSSAVLAVARHELAILRRGSVAIGVAAAFLAVQGVAFAGQVALLSDPNRPAPLGAVLQGYFAGNLLSWTVWIAVLCGLAVQAVGGQRAGGGWELLVTAPVSDGRAVVGKWLAASLFQALLWVPTLLYLVVLTWWSPGNATFAWGPVAAAYLGVIAVGSGLLALAIGASAISTNPLLGGAAAFVLLLSVSLLSDVGQLVGGVLDSPRLVAIVDSISVRTTVADLARGEVFPRAVALPLAFIVVGLTAATALLGRGRRRRIVQRLSAISVVLTIACAALGVLLVSHAPWHWDVSGNRANSLQPATRKIVSALPEPTIITVVRPTLAAFADVYAEVDRVLARMAALGPTISVEHVDAALLPAKVAALAVEAGLGAPDLAQGGAVVVQVGNRRRVIELLALAGFGRDVLAAPTVTGLAVEAEVASRLRELSGQSAAIGCVVTGAGEADLGQVGDGADPRGWDSVGERLRGDDIELRAVAVLDDDSLLGCTFVVMASGSGRTPAEMLALSGVMDRGVGVVVALNAQAPAATIVNWLASRGVQVGSAEVVDDPRSLDDTGRFRVDNYSEHAVNDGFAGRRVTVWDHPVGLVVSPPALPLISTSPLARDRSGAPPATHVLAAASEVGATRLVVIATDDLLPEASGDAGGLWATQAVRWAAHRERVPMVDAVRTPEQVRLIMTSGERTSVMAVCVVGVPALVVIVGLMLLRRRRRRGRSSVPV